MKMLSNNRRKFYSTHLLQEVLQESVVLVYKFIEKLGAGDVHAVEDGELFVAEKVVGGRAGLQDLSVCVLILDLPDLPQQGIQMLNENMKAYNIVSLTLHTIYKLHNLEKMEKLTNLF